MKKFSAEFSEVHSQYLDHSENVAKNLSVRDAESASVRLGGSKDSISSFLLRGSTINRLLPDFNLPFIKSLGEKLKTEDLTGSLSIDEAEQLHLSVTKIVGYCKDQCDNHIFTTLLIALSEIDPQFSSKTLLVPLYPCSSDESLY